MKILVTGGAGFIGNAVVRALVRAGHSVRSLDNASRGRHARLNDVTGDVEVIAGDVRDLDSVIAAAQGVDSVHHLACINGTEHFYTMPDVVLDVAIRGTLNVLDACQRWAIPELVFMSSSEVYQTPPRIPTDESVPLSIPDLFNPRYSYAGGKIAGELLAIHSRTRLQRVLIARPHNVYGPDMGTEHVIPQFILRLATRLSDPEDPIPLPIKGTGNETRAFVYIDDFIRGYMKMVEHGSHRGVYHIGTSEEIAIRDLAGAIGRCLGRNVAVIPGEAAPGGTERRCPDTSKLNALGWRPQWSLEEGLRATISWYVT